MTKIAINGKNIHEIQMRLKGENNKGIAYLSYPEHRIFNKEKAISVKIKNKELGLFKIQDVLYPNELYDDGLVEIIFKR